MVKEIEGYTQEKFPTPVKMACFTQLLANKDMGWWRYYDNTQELNYILWCEKWPVFATYYSA